MRKTLSLAGAVYFFVFQLAAPNTAWSQETVGGFQIEFDPRSIAGQGFSTNRGFVAGSSFAAAEVRIARTVSGKSIYGYSEAVGQWTKLAHEFAPEEKLTPISMGKSICMVVGRKAFAFSGPKGRWDVIDVPDGATPFADATCCSIEIDNKIYIFSPTAGRWSMVDLTVD